eukprot:3966340-Pleurochrysis_carterae.AAC.1
MSLELQRSVARNTTMWASHSISASRLSGSAQNFRPSTFQRSGNSRSRRSTVSATIHDIVLLRRASLKTGPPTTSRRDRRQLNAYHRSNLAVDTRNRNPPAQSARTPPVACEGLG